MVALAVKMIGRKVEGPGLLLLKGIRAGVLVEMELAMVRGKRSISVRGDG
jgi:hypothetical protein